jgi:hypothetical protein
MTESVPALLTPWSNFYIMVGSAAAGLTGLMFVVITLVSRTERVRRSPDGISAFSTPTVAHFGTALLVAVVLAAPWRALVEPAVLLGLVGLSGLVYLLRVTTKQMRMTSYEPDLEDWIWYTILPIIAYGAVLAGAILFFTTPAVAMFVLATGPVLLIFIGIRNAWDIVTFIATGQSDKPPRGKSQ